MVGTFDSNKTMVHRTPTTTFSCIFIVSP